jgi:hypothetical protein
VEKRIFDYDKMNQEGNLLNNPKVCFDKSELVAVKKKF